LNPTPLPQNSPLTRWPCSPLPFFSSHDAQGDRPAERSGGHAVPGPKCPLPRGATCCESVWSPAAVAVAGQPSNGPECRFQAQLVAWPMSFRNASPAPWRSSSRRRGTSGGRCGPSVWRLRCLSEADPVRRRRVLATPSHFHPIHLKAAVEAGRHVLARSRTARSDPGPHGGRRPATRPNARDLRRFGALLALPQDGAGDHEASARTGPSRRHVGSGNLHVRLLLDACPRAGGSEMKSRCATGTLHWLSGDLPGLNAGSQSRQGLLGHGRRSARARLGHGRTPSTYPVRSMGTSTTIRPSCFDYPAARA